MGRPESRHSLGRAADVVLPGVSDRKLARYFRGLPSVGVGLYPNSGFVHIDVREASYHWIDNSFPGHVQRVRPLKGKAKRTTAIKQPVVGDEHEVVPSPMSPSTMH